MYLPGKVFHRLFQLDSSVLQNTVGPIPGHPPQMLGLVLLHCKSKCSLHHSPLVTKKNNVLTRKEFLLIKLEVGQGKVAFRF